MTATDTLIGKTIKAIEVGPRKEWIVLRCTDGSTYKYYHGQECCETVMIEEVVGELDDLLGSPITVASERSNRKESWGGGETWTFYEFATNKGSVTIRWYGESNGYYSESVDLEYSPGETPAAGGE